ncbi:MAG TPA: type II toxin-antitoxin system VapC family toxin [Candidatus Acidoferrum sp.]|nr:type II toxin-antitoxin system VapC family toxin [Candidatus Acidoferrum sp.]
MPGRVLLDTNVVIAFFSREKAVFQRVLDHEICLPITVLGELHNGARKSAHGEANAERIDEFAAAVPVFSCDADTAKHYGRIKDQLRSKGRPIPENDIWIAALAAQHGLPLATRDEHFAQIEGLRVEKW